MITQFLVALVAALHFSFMVLEMFFWHRPFGRRAFRQSLELALASRPLAMNQGLYNGLLAAGLVASFFLGPHDGLVLRAYILIAIVAAGVFGALTVNRRILFIQALPALLAAVSLAV